ncbi:hypothetical protein Q4485_01565 [Granulosicoccaceae sp. 1_MG-2023]|nr:hypothetical protein [Granulosicoccaceae sp. 1_MG-2023]
MEVLLLLAAALAIYLYFLRKKRGKRDRPADQASRLKAEKKVRRTIEFSYLNKNGERSTRMVDVQAFRHYNFSGYCRLRKKQRTFRYARIIGDIVDVNTGEVLTLKDLSPVARTDGLPPQTDVVSLGSPQASLFELFEQRRQGLAKLGWLVQTDEDGVGLYRVPGPLTRRQPPDVLIRYQTGSTGRPWYLRSNALEEARTFAELAELNLALDSVLLRSLLQLQLRNGQIPLDLSL